MKASVIDLFLSKLKIRVIDVVIGLTDIRTLGTEQGIDMRDAVIAIFVLASSCFIAYKSKDID